MNNPICIIRKTPITELAFTETGARNVIGFLKDLMKMYELPHLSNNSIEERMVIARTIEYIANGSGVGIEFKGDKNEEVS